MDAKKYLNEEVEIIIDRPFGSHHPKHGFIYPVNYGYVPNTISGDGEELDAYLLGVFTPVESFKGKCIAIIHRTDDDDDKLVIVPDGKNYTDRAIDALTEFQEQYFHHEIIRSDKKQVLIATSNYDKFKTVKSIFENTIFPKSKYQIESLKTLGLNIHEEKEVGDNLKRAHNKAINAYKELKDYNFSFIVGLDDAIRMKGRLEPNIKMYLEKILYEDYLTDYEEFAFSRGYSIIDSEGKIYETVIETPYIYRSNKNATINSNSYPLSQISYPIGYDKIISLLDEDEQLKYYLKYAKDKLNALNINND